MNLQPHHRKQQLELFPKIPTLKKRKLEIARLVSEGLPNKLIAYELGLTYYTVKAYMYYILKSTNCSNRAQLAVWYIKNAKSDNLD